MTAESGLGHWMRCYNLAAALQHQGYQIHALQSPQLKAMDLFMPTEFIQWHATPAALHQEETLAHVELLQELQPFDVVIIDGYQFSASYRKTLRNKMQRVITFDDINDCPAYHCDLLINSSANAMQLGYTESAEDAALFLGPDYRQFAHGYLLAREQLIIKSNWANRNALTIIMGGADTHSLTMPLLQSLQALDWLDDAPSINVITTELYSNKAMIHKWCAKQMNLTVIHQQFDLSAVFLSSKLVISAAGGSSYELQLCAAPSLSIIIAENQRQAASNSQANGWSEMWDWTSRKDMMQMADRIKELWLKTDSLKSMHNKLIFDMDKARVPELATHVDRFIRESADG